MKTQSPRRIHPVFLVAVVIAAVAVAILAGIGIGALGGDGASGEGTSEGGLVDPAAAAATAFPGLDAPEGAPQLDSIARAEPRPGEILQAAGPFDDRFVLEGLAFDGQTVSGVVRITSDVSELLELEVIAGFFDDQGGLLGTDRYVHHLDHDEGHSDDLGGGPEVSEDFTVPVPAEFAGRAASVALGVPVLVNE